MGLPYLLSWVIFICLCRIAVSMDDFDKNFNETLRDDFVEIYSLDGIYKMEIRSMENVVWKVKYKGRPPPTFEWYDNAGQIIRNSNEADSNYEVEITSDYVILKIKSVQFKDAGFYTLKAANIFTSSEKKFELRVKVAPSIYVDNKVVRINEIAKFVCSCTGYPISTITWTFTACDLIKRTLCATGSRDLAKEKYFINTTSQSLESQTSVLMFNATESGQVQCKAVNTEGETEAKAKLQITDIQKGLFDIWGLATDTEIVAGDNVSIICGASVYIKSNVNWFLNNERVKSSDVVRVERCDTEFSRREMITWTGITPTHSGTYECHMTNVDDSLISATKKLSIKVYEPQKPKLMDDTPLEEIEVQLGAPSQLFCNVIGYPIPEIKWYKNEELIGNSTKHKMPVNMKTLDINETELDDDSEFRCIGTNNLGSVRKIFKLKVTSMKSMKSEWIIGATVVFLVIIFSSIYIFLRFIQLRAELDAAKNINLDGKPEALSPDLPLHQQIDFLPYDKRYEFPKEKLKLGAVLGSGAFGVVLKGHATGILASEEETSVAVKKLKETADNEKLVALLTELKIMVHMGQHLNVVNLLGAVTKNIVKRELMLIVEFCRFGNLQTYLAKNRDSFVNQVNIYNDSIDPTMSSMDQGNTKSTQITTETNPPTMRSITSTDLVSWLFQVTRGMGYLSSKKVIHGDLAARNVLLCDDNIVKICDFGLARSMYKCSNYVKHGHTPLPFKWLAIESIRDQVFSTFSDVWSFGIVMWELFSLGQTPYAGMDADHNLFLRLTDGYRMEKPEYATQEIYDIMLNCWNVNQESRPSFNALEEKFGKLLRNGEAEHYIDLNEQYIAMRVNDFKKHPETDYLALKGSPEAMAPPAPVYAHPIYMAMKPILKIVKLGNDEIDMTI